MAHNERRLWLVDRHHHRHTNLDCSTTLITASTAEYSIECLNPAMCVTSKGFAMVDSTISSNVSVLTDSLIPSSPGVIGLDWIYAPSCHPASRTCPLIGRKQVIELQRQKEDSQTGQSRQMSLKSCQRLVIPVPYRTDTPANQPAPCPAASSPSMYGSVRYHTRYSIYFWRCLFSPPASCVQLPYLSRITPCLSLIRFLSPPR